MQEFSTTVGQGGGRSVGPRISDNTLVCKLKFEFIHGCQRKERPPFGLVNAISLVVEIYLAC